MVKKPNLSKNSRLGDTFSQATDKAKSLVKRNGDSSSEEVDSKTVTTVTNKTLEEHREEVLKGAQRFIYPLQHSKHKIAIYSGTIVVTVAMLFISFTAFMLYRWQDTGDFAYRVSQIIPYPVARVDSMFVSYEDYLFELRHNIHFLLTQEQVDLDANPNQLDSLKREALFRVKENAMIKKIAKDNDISVSDEEVDQQVEIIRRYGGVSESSKALESTLENYYGWSVSDWKKSLKQQILRQKTISVIDTNALDKAKKSKAAVDSGESFASVAKKYSDDSSTRDKGGKITSLRKSSQDYPANFVYTAFQLKDGEVTGDFVYTPYGMHIIKKLETINDDAITIAHIFIRYDDIDATLAEMIAEDDTNYIHIPERNEEGGS